MKAVNCFNTFLFSDSTEGSKSCCITAATHSSCHTPSAQCLQHEAVQPGRVTGAALGAQRREVRLEEGPQLSANAAPISFHELGLSPFFSFFPFEEKAIKNYLLIVPSSSSFISTARTLTTMSEGMKDDLNYQQKGCSESKGNLHTETYDCPSFLHHLGYFCLLLLVVLSPPQFPGLQSSCLAGIFLLPITWILPQCLIITLDLTPSTAISLFLSLWFLSAKQNLSLKYPPFSLIISPFLNALRHLSLPLQAFYTSWFYSKDLALPYTPPKHTLHIPVHVQYMMKPFPVPSVWLLCLSLVFCYLSNNNEITHMKLLSWIDW